MPRTARRRLSFWVFPAGRTSSRSKRILFISDLIVELGLLCADEDDIGELNEMYAPLCWQGCEKRSWRVQEADVVWNYEGIQVQGHLHVVQVWRRERETAFTHQQFGEIGKERKAQLDYIIGPRWKSDEAHFYNDVQTLDSWDHYPIYAVVQEYEASNCFCARKKKEEMDSMEGQ